MKVNNLEHLIFNLASKYIKYSKSKYMKAALFG